MACRLNIIVAVAENGVIGGSNSLLWHISEDLRRFKRITTGCPVIMGRKTYESIGRPLPSRRNIVVSRQKELHIDGCEVFPSLEEAVAACSEAAGLESAVRSDAGIGGSARAVYVGDDRSAADRSDTDVAGCRGGGLSHGAAPAEAFVIGGGEIYRQAIPMCDRILLTRVLHSYEGDTVFPEIDPAEWRVTEREEFARGEKFPYPFVFETLERR